MVAREWRGSGSEGVTIVEPTYEYRKGVGWVPSYYKVRSERIGEFIVTAIDRVPELGEHYFTHLDADELFTEIHDDWWTRRLTNRNWEPLNEFAIMDDTEYSKRNIKAITRDEAKIVTVIFELVPL